MNTDNLCPIYIIGNSRSGTTLIAKILGRNSAIFAFNEIHFFEELCDSDENKQIDRKYAELLGARLLSIQRKGYFSATNPEIYLNESKKLIQGTTDENLSPISIYKTFLAYETRKNNKRYPLKQMPRNTFYVPEIKKNIPSSRFIHMVRDPRDVLLSQKGKWRRRFLGKWVPWHETFRAWANYHPIVISKLWNFAVRTADKHVKNSNAITIRFEDLLSDPKGEVTRACNFLGVTFSEDMLNVPRSGSSNVSDEPKKAGITLTMKGRWQNKLNPVEIYWCQLINKPLIRHFGYRYYNVEPNVLSMFLSILSMPLKLSISLLLNLKRTQNVLSSIKRRLA